MHYPPCERRYNVKAWMTREVFKMWIVSLARRRKVEKRKIPLLIGNFSAHKNTAYVDIIEYINFWPWWNGSL
jgi:hypothetical protein